MSEVIVVAFFFGKSLSNPTQKQGQFSARIILCILMIMTICLQSSKAHAESDIELNDTDSKSTWRLVKDKIRVRTFTEFMTPSFKGNSKSFPTPDGDALNPSNAYNIAWIDYEIAPDWKILYWQRLFVNLDSRGANQGFHTMIRNPRFALRRTNVFSNPNLATTYDFYLQPGISDEGVQLKRPIEAGFRTNTNYTIPKSKWNIGTITEFTVTTDPDSTFYGWALSWATYDINPTFSTQHYATINFQQLRNSKQTLSWDYPMPYTQNGIGINISKTVWAAAFLNNYLVSLPTLKNTWASIWIALTLL